MAIKKSAAIGGSARASNGRRQTDGTDCMVSIATLLVVLMFPGSASAAPYEGQSRAIDEHALLNWATHLSRYSTDENLPEVQYKPREFFVEHACLGREDCRVLGWYNDQDIVYVDESLATMDSLFERSLLVHEFVHVLQHRSGDFDEHDCEKFVEREREAYAVQQAFFVAHGAVPTVRSRHYSCTAKAVMAKTVVDDYDDVSQTAHSRQAIIRAGDQAETTALVPICAESDETCLSEHSTPSTELSGSVQ